MLGKRGRDDAARILAVGALVGSIVVLFMPLHLIGAGQFGDAFPLGVGTRLTIGFLIQAFTLPIMIATGLGLLLRHRGKIASGVFLACGVFSVLDGLTAPFYALPRLQPMTLLAIRVVVGGALFAAAWQAQHNHEST